MSFFRSSPSVFNINCQIEVRFYLTKLTGEGCNRSICKFVTLPVIANAQPRGMKSCKNPDKFSGEMSGLGIEEAIISMFILIK